MNKLLSLIILGIGVALLVYGAIAADSISSDLSRFFTGEPTDETVWLLLGGAVATIVGLVGLMRGSSLVAGRA